MSPWSDTSITVRVPSGADGPVTVTTPGGVSNPAPFTVTTGTLYTVTTKTMAAVQTAVTNAAYGDTVYCPVGTYAGSTTRLTMKEGVNLYGDGAGKSILAGPITLASHSTIGGALESQGLCIGSSTALTEHRFANGAHSIAIGNSRFRSHYSGSSGNLFNLNDAGGIAWANAVVNDKANVHDVVFTDCEFESPGSVGSSTAQFFLWVCFPDTRSGGGTVYDITWDGCDWGVKNSVGHYSQGYVGLIIQPGPTEHKADGPRPSGLPVDMNFDWTQVTHGIGRSAFSTPGGTRTSDSTTPYGEMTTPSSAGYGFRVWDCNFVGPAGFESVAINPCDFIRAWCMTVLGTGAGPTQEQQDLAPDKCSLHTMDFENVWVGGSLRREYGRDIVRTNVLTSQGTATYHVAQHTLDHDSELYGF